LSQESAEKHVGEPLCQTNQGKMVRLRAICQPSLQEHVQVMCGEHLYLMFLESFDLKTRAENFRCPQKNCQHTMNLVAGSPHAYWLGDGFFKAQ
jgi:hypothetical protein